MENTGRLLGTQVKEIMVTIYEIEVALADSNSAGHEAPITGCTSIIPFVGTFHTGFFDFVALSLLLSKIWITSDDR
ncbi:hypothetical protein AAC387_Pa07g0030 [Persea americana]